MTSAAGTPAPATEVLVAVLSADIALVMGYVNRLAINARGGKLPAMTAPERHGCRRPRRMNLGCIADVHVDMGSRT